MKSIRFAFSLLTVSLLLLSGCSLERDGMTDPSSVSIPDLGSSYVASPGTGIMNPSSALIYGYLVTFDGKTYDQGMSTFHYTVSGEGAESVLSHFFLELPDCAPQLDSYQPPDRAYILTNPYIGIFGIKWEYYIYPGQVYHHSLTYPGDVSLGIITTSLKSGDDIGTAQIIGPCAGFEISGALFVDADADGIRDAADASGIENVTVSISDGNGGRATTLTGVDGSFSFITGAGTFVLSIETETPEDDFNEELASAFNSTTPSSRLITVGPDSPGNLFGFDPRTTEIIEELETGTVETDGQPPKFWIKEIRAAMHGQTLPKTEFDPETLAMFIAQVQELFLPEPFTFTPGEEFAEAIMILKNRSKDPLDILLRELLAAELNHVSGKGMIGRFSLQTVMLAWVEEVVYDVSTPEMQITTESSRDLLKLGIGDAEIGEAISFLESMNLSIGGGSGGGG